MSRLPKYRNEDRTEEILNVAVILAVVSTLGLLAWYYVINPKVS